MGSVASVGTLESPWQLCRHAQGLPGGTLHRDGKTLSTRVSFMALSSCGSQSDLGSSPKMAVYCLVTWNKLSNTPEQIPLSLKGR